MITRNIKNWQLAFEEGAFLDPDRNIQIDAGWYDWFCKDTSLLNKTKTMGSIIKQIKDGGKVDLEKSYIFFKNNCPVNGPLYDDFRICSLETKEVQFTIQINCCWNQARYAVLGIDKDGNKWWDKPMFETDSKRELVKWLNQPWED